MPFEIIRNDITKVDVDVVVNAANTALQAGSGVCGAIFAAAGEKQLQMECNRIGGCDVGEAVITGGYNLKAKYIIHTPGPIWRGGDCDEEKLLADCYNNSLKLAVSKNCTSIAFPLISAGIYGYPKDKAIKVAVNTIREFLNDNEINVYLVIFDRNAGVIGEQLYSKLNKYIDDRYVVEKAGYNRRRADKPDYDISSASVLGSKIPFSENILYNDESMQFCKNSKLDYISLPKKESIKIQRTSEKEPRLIQKKFACRTFRRKRRRLEDMVQNIDETFSQMLLRLIDEKGMTDVETYKKANIDRKLFSKIKKSSTYNPSKVTAIAFAIALELEIDETKDLLLRAGYALSRSNIFDIIIEYFIEQKNYDVYEINEALFEFNQNLLGV